MSQPKKRKLCTEEEEKIVQTEPEYEDFKFLDDLEKKIREFPLWTEIVSSIINPLSEVPQNNLTKDIKEQELALLNRIKENVNEVLLSAAKYEKEIVVDFLIKCGVNVNGGNSKSAADLVWTKKNYKILLLLLKADSFYPDGFNLDGLSEDDDSVREIQNLVDRRNKLHEIIENGGVDDVKNFEFDENSRLYLNMNNESVAYIALKRKKFVTYAYLKSLGAEFGKDTEKEVINGFGLPENVALQEAMVQYFPAKSDAHIFYLISKSRFQKQSINLPRKLMDYYYKLNQIPEISAILKVVQYADYLDIIFDFDEEEVSKVYPLVSSENCSRGETVYKVGRIYIAASLEKRKKVEILGTIAHELTHMAMQILYENDCNPYREADEVCENFFRSFKSRIKKEIPKNLTDPSKILLDALDKYSEKDRDSELIVRVPHILAQFKTGRKWLEEKIPEFVKFYNEEIVSKCQRYLDESVILKPKSIIKSINESVGEMVRLKNCKIFFTTTPKLRQSDGTKIFVYKVESTLLGMLKVLQGLHGKGYANFHSYFLVLNLKNFAKQLKEISQAFFMEGCKWLIIEINHNSPKHELDSVCEIISELLEIKPHKRIVFVTHRNAIKLLRRTLYANDLSDCSNETTDDDLSFDHLDADSQDQILKKKVTFQGKSITLQSLIKVPKLYKYINPGIIESLVEGRKVRIGNEILGMSSLEGPYADIIQKMDFEAFVRHVSDSNDIFIVRSKPSDEVLEYFNTKLKEEWVSAEFLKNQIFDFEKISNEKVFLVNDRFRSEDLKNFCRVNPVKKCHLIDVDDLTTDSFVLREFYNPHFYEKRKLKKILIKTNVMKRLVNEGNSEIFIVSDVPNSKKYIFQEDTNVKYLDGKQAEDNFNTLSKPGHEVHWFTMENDQFTWKNSYGSVANLSGIFKEIKAENEEEYDEDWEGDLETDDEDDSDREAPNEYQKNLRKEKAESRVLREENLASEILHKRIMLIADDPGTGKSTTLTKLYEVNKVASAHWIIRINLKDHLKAIRDQIANDIDIEKAIRFLQDIDQNLKNELNENFLKEALINDQFPKCLLLAFDGYDEVLDEEDREKVIELLKYLKNHTRSKIWITSRLQYKKELEYHLGTFALEFDPFDDDMKKSFVKKYLEDRLNLILNEKLFSDIFKGEKVLTFSEKLLSKMRKIFKKGVTKFIGTPLQLNLVMFGSLEYFTKWIRNDLATLDFTYLGDDLSGVYENFVRQKYEIYFKKCNIIIGKRQKRDKKIAEKYHKDLAESLIYERKMLPPEEDDKEINLLVGLIQSQADENFEFIHFTFREYYFAQTFANYIEKLRKIDPDKVIFLFQEIFVKREFEMIRSFFNIRFKHKIPEENFQELKRIFLSNEVLKLYTTLDSVLAVAAQEGCENNFNFFYSVYNFTFSSFEITNILNRSLFSVSAIAGKWEIWESLFGILENVKLSKKWKVFYYKCLISESARFATETKFWKLEKSLLEKMQKNFSSHEMRYFLTSLNKMYKTPHKIVEKSNTSEVFELLVKIAGEIFTKEEQYEFLITPNKRGPTALFAAAIKKDPKFMEILLEKSKELIPREDLCLFLTMRNNSLGTILHEAARAGRLETIRLIFDKTKDVFDDQSEFLTMTNQRERNALCNAVFTKRLELTKFLIAKGEEILNPEKLEKYITIRDKFNKTILHLAVEFEHNLNLDLLKFIFQEAGRILPEEKMAEWMMTVDVDPNGKGSILHLACQRGDEEILQFVLLKAREIFTTPEKLRQFLIMTNKRRYNILHLITDSNKEGVVKLLFQKLEPLFLPREDIVQLFMMRSCFGTVLHEAAFWNKMPTMEVLLQKAEKYLTPENLRELFMVKGSRRYQEMRFFRCLVHAQIGLVKFVWGKMEKFLNPDDLALMLAEKDLIFSNILFPTVSNVDTKVMEFMIDKVEKILCKEQQQQLLTTIGFNKRSLLQAAIVKNSAGAFSLLIEKMRKMLEEDDLLKLLINQDFQGNTILHLAADNDEPDLLKVVLDKTNEILLPEKQRQIFFLKNKKKENALTVVQSNCKFEIVKLIFEHIQNIFTPQDQRLYLTQSYNQGTIFHLAANCNKPDLLHFLFEKSNGILSPEDRREIITTQFKFRPYFLLFTFTEKFLNTILHIVAFSGEPEVMKILLQHIDKEYERELFKATNGENQTPLHAILSSCYSIKPEAVKLLLEKLDQSLTPKDWHEVLTTKDNIYGSILHSTAINNEMEIVKLILEKLKKVLGKNGLRQLFLIKDDEFGSVFQAALYNKDSKVPKLVLEKGKELMNQEEKFRFFSMTDQNGRTALHIAASTEEPELKWGQRQETVLSAKVNCLTALNDKTEFIYFIIKETEGFMTSEERKCFLKTKDSDDKTALHVAAEDGKLEAVKLLLQEAEKILGEDLKNFISDIDSNKRTALELSSCTNNYLITSLLTKFSEEKIKKMAS